jgi:hypothetical protein
VGMAPKTIQQRDDPLLVAKYLYPLSEGLTHERLAELGLRWEISGKGKPAPFWATNRWVVERTNS